MSNGRFLLLRARLWRIVRTVAVVYLVVVLVMMWAENSLVYIPTAYPGGDWQAVEEVRVRVEEVHFDAEDGTRIHGLWVPDQKPQAVLIYFHGNAGNVAGRLSRILRLQRRYHLSVLAFDYRGYGKSQGSPSEEGVMQDGVAAVKWLSERVKQEPSQFVFLGRSLGGGVAVAMACRFQPKALILESTFTSLPDVAARKYPWLPVKLIMKNQMNSGKRISGFKGPVLQSHGTVDRIIPFDLGRRLHAQIPGQKKFIELTGFGHNGRHPREYDKHFADFLSGLE